MRRMRIMGVMLALALPAFGQSNLTSRVVFSLKTHAGGSQGRSLRFTPVVSPDDDGANLFWDGSFDVPATNSLVTVNLEPNDYDVEMVDVPGTMRISVPTNGLVYNAVNISTNLASYLGAASGPATVVWPVLTMRGGAQNNPMTLEPIINPVRNGTNIVWGQALSVTPTNGLATTLLEPNGYNVSMLNVFGTMTKYVPTDGGTYNAVTLPSVMPTNTTGPDTNSVWFSGLGDIMNGAQDVSPFDMLRDNGRWSRSGSTYVSPWGDFLYYYTNGNWHTWVVTTPAGYVVLYDSQTNATAAPNINGLYDYFGAEGVSVRFGTNSP